ncbi:MAG: type II secretion system ATPase GspE [Hydrogenophilales bacterium]|nr:type II secretion system ATPase GspE [Hydrogenophilales bacterium]
MSSNPGTHGKRIGERLIAQGKLDQLKLTRALAAQKESGSGERLGAILVKLDLVSERDLYQALSEQLGIPLADAIDYPQIPVLEERVSIRFLKQAHALPLHEDEHKLILALSDPLDEYTLSAFKLLTGRELGVVMAPPSELEAALDKLYTAGKGAMGQIVSNIEASSSEEESSDVQHLKDLASEAPVIRLVNLLITRALEQRASDIHIEPFESRLIIRYRVDGVMHEVESPPNRLSAAVISRIKIMANLDIAERRLPQDGRIKLRALGKEIDMRVSTVPTMHGESVVMRILDKGGVQLDFNRLGFEPDTLVAFLDVLMRPHGIVLVTGPTGSGKTTTLYTALHKLNKPDIKILTVEDPVEYQMDGVNQIQVKPQIGLTFANALRSIVRQDPDVIMIGEIRDLETAQIAVQSALTGHMVLSTLHTNDAPSTVNRLLDMGVEDYLLTSTVNGILAQRLVRGLCPDCKQAYEPLPEMVDELHLAPLFGARPRQLYRAVGCPNCAGTGYMGRLGIMEVMPMTDALRSQIMRHAVAGEIRKLAVSEGMRTMYEDGLLKAVAGVTTVDEVLRVTRED